MVTYLINEDSEIVTLTDHGSVLVSLLQRCSNITGRRKTVSHQMNTSSFSVFFICNNDIIHANICEIISGKDIQDFLMERSFLFCLALL